MKIFIYLPLIALSVSIAFARVGAHDHQSFQFPEGAQAQLDPRIITTPPIQLCSYVIVVRTGDVGYAGTDAIIDLTLTDKYGTTLSIEDLASWGRNSPGYNYFERGNTDMFIVTGNCMTTKPCKMLLLSNNSGDKPGWYVDYVQVAEYTTYFTQGSHTFKVNQWLAKDEFPYQLYAYRDDCSLLPGVTAIA